MFTTFLVSKIIIEIVN